MATWTLKAIKPAAGTGGAGTGFTSPPAATGFSFDDTVALANWIPGGSTVQIQLRKILQHIEQSFPVGDDNNMSGGWLYCFDNGAGTVIWPNRDPL